MDDPKLSELRGTDPPPPDRLRSPWAVIGMGALGAALFGSCTLMTFPMSPIATIVGASSGFCLAIIVAIKYRDFF
jgi:hypothetical protein